MKSMAIFRFSTFWNLEMGFLCQGISEMTSMSLMSLMPPQVCLQVLDGLADRLRWRLHHARNAFFCISSLWVLIV